MPETFASLTRQYRERADYSNNELARAVGVDQSYVSRWERGVRAPPRRPIILRLITALGLSQSEADRLLLSAGYAPDEWAARLARLEQFEALSH